MKILSILLLFVSCAHQGPKGTPKEGKTLYSYADVSGSYKQSREFKKIKQQIISRGQIISSTGNKSSVLEKSITLSKLGSIKAKKNRLVTLRPEASEFTVWLEGKKYSSKMKLNPRNRSMRLTLDSPEAKWRGTSEVAFPKGKYFCFFNQIPECLYHNYLLTRAYEAPKRKIDFYIIWDSYPYIQDQMVSVGNNLFAPASIKFDGEIKRNFRYIVEVEGQLILYHFSKNFDFVKMAWIAQGITVVPPGEEVHNDE